MVLPESVFMSRKARDFPLKGAVRPYFLATGKGGQGGCERKRVRSY
jgi:hypothetical protein